MARRLLGAGRPPRGRNGERVIIAARKARALPDSYLVDVARLVSLQQGKHAPTYLLGRWSADGWPQYYLVAFAVKSTPGFLLACAAAALVASAVPPLVTTWAGRVAVIVIASLHAVPTILAARDDPSRYQIRHKDLPGAHICDEGYAGR